MQHFNRNVANKQTWLQTQETKNNSPDVIATCRGDNFLLQNSLEPRQNAHRRLCLIMRLLVVISDTSGIRLSFFKDFV